MYYKSHAKVISAARHRGYKKIFMLNSAEQEILNALTYKNIEKCSFFQAQISLESYFSCS